MHCYSSGSYAILFNGPTPLVLRANLETPTETKLGRGGRLECVTCRIRTTWSDFLGYTQIDIIKVPDTILTQCINPDPVLYHM